MSCSTLITNEVPMRVVVDGRQLYQGHKLAWRGGYVEDIGHANCVAVVLDPIGRERKPKRHVFARAWLFKETPELLEQLKPIRGY